ncbi:MAG: hypothetical protein IPQ07_05795 [Myxococcales bacterium]|nr:hypothetical protein [Myxococcales bacterium]
MRTASPTIARLVAVTLVGSLVAVAHARPPRLARGEQPRMAHIVENTPDWVAACPLTVVQEDPETFAVGASCGAFETMMFERKRLDAKEFEERVRDEAQEAGAALVGITIPTALGPATGFTFVLQDKQSVNTYVMVRRPGAQGSKPGPSDMLSCTSAVGTDPLARCKAALEALGRSSVVRSGRGGFPRAAGERAGS